MSKYVYRFMIIVLLTFVGVGILGSGQVFASGGSFNVPQVNDHFEKVKQGPAPTKEPSLTQAPQKEHGSWDWITEPVSKAWNWTKEKVSSGWKWLKQTAYSEWEKAKNGDWLAGILALILMISIVQTSFGIGVLKALWETVKGIGYMIIHPIKTVEGIIEAFSHPVETGKAVWKFISESFKRDVINGDASSRAEWLGYVVGSLVGAKGVDKLGKLSKVAMLSKVSKVSRAAEMGQLGRIGRGINLVQKTARKLRIPQTVSKVRGTLSGLRKLILGNKVAASVITVVGLTTGMLALDPEAFIQAFNKITVAAEKFEVKTAFKKAEKCFGYQQPTHGYFASIQFPNCFHSPDGGGGSGKDSSESPKLTKEEIKQRQEQVAKINLNPNKLTHPDLNSKAGKLGIDSEGKPYFYNYKGELERPVNINLAGKKAQIELQNGERIEVPFDITGFPDFKNWTVYETRLPVERWKQSDRTQFRYLSKEVAKKIENATTPEEIKLKKDIMDGMFDTIKEGAGFKYGPSKFEAFINNGKLNNGTSLKSLLKKEEIEKLAAGQPCLELYDRIQQDPKLKEAFIEANLNRMKDGKDPAGFTWHHHQEFGKMQLVKTNVHEAINHTGGRQVWGFGR